MAFPIPPAHLPGAQPDYPIIRTGVVRRLHNRRIVVARLPDGNCYIHISLALKPGEAEELRHQEGYIDCASDYILRDRVRYSVIVLTGEAMDAIVSGWSQLGEVAEQRKKRKRI
ncbi:hypothetical protein [Hymenobacter sp. BT559]|uniref:hypothetical protein n=1 Tax=Hymenobacter sp. BT559 TaxID=2795729 RepID=UPI0018EBCAD8|nr:hypothetical protein [Hymenobacter sp. BT559]MBJ6146399.1 hypothetical protein [Hymenobacter sp. BT559]